MGQKKDVDLPNNSIYHGFMEAKLDLLENKWRREIRLMVLDGNDASAQTTLECLNDLRVARGRAQLELSDVIEDK
jgi:hypothetical protein